MRRDHKGHIDKRPRRGAGGATTVELAASAFILSFMTVFALNVYLVLLGIVVNDRACRDAARAASRARSLADATTIARAAVRAHNPGVPWIDDIVLASSDVTYEDYNANIQDIQSAATIPYVTVVTRTRVKIPAPQLFFGVAMDDDGYINTGSSCTFPITNLNVVIPGEAP